MIKILTLILFLASSSSLIANDVFNFVNHEPIKTIEYKTYNYDNQKIKIPIINGIAPEVTIKNRNNYKETTYDYTNKTKFDSNKNYVTEEKQNEINKEKEINKKIQSMEEKIQSMENKVQLLLATMSNLYLQLEEQKAISNKQEAKQLDFQNDIFKKMNDIVDDIKNMGKMEKTMDIIEKMKNDDIKEKNTNKLQKTNVPNIIQKNEEKTPKMKKPSEVIK